MSKSLMGTLLGLAVMVLVSFKLEGTVLMGAWAGFLMGAGVGCALVGWQESQFRKDPRRAMSVLAQGFIVKLLVLALMSLALKTIPALGERIDAMALLVAAASGMFLLLTLGTLDNSAVLHESSRQAHMRAVAANAQGMSPESQQLTDPAQPSSVPEGTSSL